MVVNYKEVDDFVDSINTVLCRNDLVKSDYDSILNKVTTFCAENRLPIYLCYVYDGIKFKTWDDVIELAFATLSDAREWKKNFNPKLSCRWLVKVDKFGNIKDIR